MLDTFPNMSLLEKTVQNPDERRVFRKVDSRIFGVLLIYIPFSFGVREQSYLWQCECTYW